MHDNELIEELKKLHNTIYKQLAQTGKGKGTCKYLVMDFMRGIILEQTLSSLQQKALEELGKTLEPCCAETILKQGFVDCLRCRLSEETYGCMDDGTTYLQWVKANDESQMKKMLAAKILLLWR